MFRHYLLYQEMVVVLVVVMLFDFLKFDFVFCPCSNNYEIEIVLNKNFLT